MPVKIKYHAECLTPDLFYLKYYNEKKFSGEVITQLFN